MNNYLHLRCCAFSMLEMVKEQHMLCLRRALEIVWGSFVSVCLGESFCRSLTLGRTCGGGRMLERGFACLRRGSWGWLAGRACVDGTNWMYCDAFLLGALLVKLVVCHCVF